MSWELEDRMEPVELSTIEEENTENKSPTIASKLSFKRDSSKLSPNNSKMETNTHNNSKISEEVTESQSHENKSVTAEVTSVNQGQNSPVPSIGELVFLIE